MHVNRPRAIARGWLAGMNVRGLQGIPENYYNKTQLAHLNIIKWSGGPTFGTSTNQYLSQADLEQDSVGWLLNLVSCSYSHDTHREPRQHYRLPFHHHHLARETIVQALDEHNNTGTVTSMTTQPQDDFNEHNHDEDERTITILDGETDRQRQLARWTNGALIPSPTRQHHIVNAALQPARPQSDTARSDRMIYEDTARPGRGNRTTRTRKPHDPDEETARPGRGHRMTWTTTRTRTPHDLDKDTTRPRRGHCTTWMSAHRQQGQVPTRASCAVTMW
ncbi:hypothetical protein BDZ89DRAFT_1050581 [Hymenopellis radicata]|nr:hypothetical protein BDZ89DRAFT_1050581 [Hymenopellis radicata]